jgi:hypothetical protein
MAEPIALLAIEIAVPKVDLDIEFRFSETSW